jgi:hypothetical protein
MYWNATDDRYNEALRRIAVVLLLLARLCERAGCRSWPIRSLFLWLLGRAEERVRDFAVRAGAGALPIALCIDPRGEDAEAARLAKTFRALAAAFFALARPTPQWRRMARRHDPFCVLLNCRTMVGPERLCFADRRPYADTS